MTYIIRLFSLGIFFFTLTAADNLAVLEFLPPIIISWDYLHYSHSPLRLSYLFRFYVSSYGSILEFEYVCQWLFESEASEIINCKQRSQYAKKAKLGG